MRRGRVRHVARVHGKASATSSTSPGSPPSALRSSRPAAGRASSRTARTRARPMERQRDFFHVALAHRLPALRGHRVRHPAASGLRGHRGRVFTAGRSPRLADFAAGHRFMLPGHRAEGVMGSAPPGRRLRVTASPPHVSTGPAPTASPLMSSEPRRASRTAAATCLAGYHGSAWGIHARTGKAGSWVIMGGWTRGEAARAAASALRARGHHGKKPLTRVPNARACG